MSDARTFMIAARAASDAELTLLVRTSMLDRPSDERSHWLKQVEMALDGYGGAQHIKAADRVASVLQLLEAEQ